MGHMVSTYSTLIPPPFSSIISSKWCYLFTLYLQTIHKHILIGTWKNIIVTYSKSVLKAFVVRFFLDYFVC